MVMLVVALFDNCENLRRTDFTLAPVASKSLKKLCLPVPCGSMFYI